MATPEAVLAALIASGIPARQIAKCNVCGQPIATNRTDPQRCVMTPRCTGQHTRRTK